MKKCLSVLCVLILLFACMAGHADDNPSRVSFVLWGEGWQCDISAVSVIRSISFAADNGNTRITVTASGADGSEVLRFRHMTDSNTTGDQFSACLTCTGGILTLSSLTREASSPVTDWLVPNRDGTFSVLLPFDATDWEVSLPGGIVEQSRAFTVTEDDPTGHTEFRFALAEAAHKHGGSILLTDFDETEGTVKQECLVRLGVRNNSLSLSQATLTMSGQ